MVFKVLAVLFVLMVLVPLVAGSFVEKNRDWSDWQ